MEQKTETTENELAVIPGNGGLMASNDAEAIKQFRLRCQEFTKQLNKFPPEESIGETPDKKAHTIFISHIETTLDEYFFGLWETQNFRWQVIGNEIVGCIDLIVYNPVSGLKTMREGAASIQIMVDKVPEHITDAKERNQWALDIQNKKPAALDMGFPKLKSECIKNAANSLGKMFGRDLNRKVQDNFQGLLRADPKVEISEELRTFIELQIDKTELDNIYQNNPHLHANPEFFKLIVNKKASIK